MCTQEKSIEMLKSVFQDKSLDNTHGQLPILIELVNLKNSLKEKQSFNKKTKTKQTEKKTLSVTVKSIRRSECGDLRLTDP